MRQRLITALTIVLLLVATARLSVLICSELLRLGAVRRQVTSIPANGSLHGIGPSGLLAPAPPGVKYQLLFVIRSSDIARDIEFWNATRRAVEPNASRIEWWGVCDGGNSCNAFQGAARFSVVGFLDPFQMWVMASANVDGLALLYEGKSLRGHVKRDAQATLTAEAIANLLQ